MGAFFLYHKNENISGEDVKDIFRKKGFLQFSSFEFSHHILYLFNKQCLDHTNYCKDTIRQQSVFVVGTLVYKGLGYDDSIKMLLHDFSKGTIHPGELLGMYFIILESGRKLFFIHDRLSYYNIYYNSKQSVFSSSFLAMIHCINGKHKINRLAVAEILLTGSLIGPDTMIHDIFRLNNQLLSFKEMERIAFRSEFKDNLPLQRKDAIQFQITAMENYFDKIRGLSNSTGISAGMTGGFDSRLLMALIIRQNVNCHFYAHKRIPPDRDFMLAREICEANHLDFHFVEPKSRSQNVSNDTTDDIFDKAYYFLDGIIRSEIYWHEYFNTGEYRKNIILDKRLELNGMGGEQFRNSERMLLPAWNFQNWTRHAYLFKHAGNCITDKDFEKNLILNIQQKICTTLGKSTMDKITKYEIHRFQNEVFNPSNRLVRNHAENQHIFCLSPFADPFISIPAYTIMNQLGSGAHFELALLNEINPSLSAFPSTYGFAFNRKEPLKFKMYALLHEMLPFRVSNYSKRKCNKHYRVVSGKYNNYIEQISLPVDFSYISRSAKLSPLVLALGYFLFKNHDKIDFQQ